MDKRISTTTQTITYSWLDPNESRPTDSDLYWVVIENKNTDKKEIMQLNYNVYINYWETFEYEKVIAWMPLNSFYPRF